VSIYYTILVFVALVRLNASAIFDDNAAVIFSVFVCCDIENYVEELLRLREAQLADVQMQHGRVSESLQSVETERKKEQAELEKVIMELQSQLSVVAISSSIDIHCIFPFVHLHHVGGK